MRLVAYVVPNTHRPCGTYRSLSQAELRSWLQGRLAGGADSLLDRVPRVPAAWTHRKTRPLGAPHSGHGVRRSGRGRRCPTHGRTSNPGRDRPGVLGNGRVGIHDNLFELGLDSILGMQLITKARDEGCPCDPAKSSVIPPSRPSRRRPGGDPSSVELARRTDGRRPRCSRSPPRSWIPPGPGGGGWADKIEAIYRLSPVQEGSSSTRRRNPRPESTWNSFSAGSMGPSIRESSRSPGGG